MVRDDACSIHEQLDFGVPRYALGSHPLGMFASAHTHPPALAFDNINGSHRVVDIRK